jgi:hypothetical protein
VKTAIEGYLPHAREDPRAARRGLRGFGAIFLLFLVIGVVVGAIAYVSGGFGTALMLFGVCAVLGLVLGAIGGRGARGMEIHDRAEAWGREAFAREYAKARGLRIEDAEQVRGRIAIPLPGRPERSMYGRLAGAVDGRLVTWRNRADPEVPNCAMNLALVPAPQGELPEVRAPYQAMRADGWLVIAESLGARARTAAGLDALAAEAARVAAPGSV